jgi:hypothetical protein
LLDASDAPLSCKDIIYRFIFQSAFADSMLQSLLHIVSKGISQPDRSKDTTGSRRTLDGGLSIMHDLADIVHVRADTMDVFADLPRRHGQNTDEQRNSWMFSHGPCMVLRNQCMVLR